MRRVILAILFVVMGFVGGSLAGCASEPSPNTPTPATALSTAAAPATTTRVDPPNAREILDRERAEFYQNYAAAGDNETMRYQAYLKYACKLLRSEQDFSENTYAAAIAYLKRDFVRDYNATTLEEEMNNSCGLPQYQ